MTRKIFSFVYLLTGLVIGLGAFGHESNTRKLIDQFERFPSFAPDVAAVTLSVWHFCSGCMFAFGIIVVWTWWRAHKRESGIFPASDAIGVLYGVTGLATVIYTGIEFFWLFVILGALLLVSAAMLRRTQ